MTQAEIDISAQNLPEPMPKPRFEAGFMTPYAFIFPALLVMLGGLLYPVFMAMYLSFYDWQIGLDLEDAPFVGLTNFSRMMTDPQVWEVLWVTIRFGFWTITIEMTLGVALALGFVLALAGSSSAQAW